MFRCICTVRFVRMYINTSLKQESPLKTSPLRKELNRNLVEIIKKLKPINREKRDNLQLSSYSLDWVL